MKINIKCFGKLAQKYECDHSKSNLLELAEGSKVSEAIEALNIEGGETKIVFVNHRINDFNTPLKEGDRVTLVPATGGM